MVDSHTALLGNAFVRGIFVFAVTIVVVMVFQWLIRQIKKTQRLALRTAKPISFER